MVCVTRRIEFGLFSTIVCVIQSLSGCLQFAIPERFGHQFVCMIDCVTDSPKKTNSTPSRNSNTLREFRIFHIYFRAV